MNEHDQLSADLLEKAGAVVGDLVKLTGDRGVAAATVVKTITFAAAQAIRHRGATVDEIVSALHKVGKLRTPFDSKVTGKDPA